MDLLKVTVAVAFGIEVLETARLRVLEFPPVAMTEDVFYMGKVSSVPRETDAGYTHRDSC